MARNLVAVSTAGGREEISAVTAIGYTPINKFGDTGIGALSMGGNLTLTTGYSVTTDTITNYGASLTFNSGGSLPLYLQTNGVTRVTVASAGGTTFSANVTAPSVEIYTAATGGLGGTLNLNNNGAASGDATAVLFNDSGLGAVSSIRGAISCTTEGAPYKGKLEFKTGAGVYSSLTTWLTITGAGASTFAGTVQATTVKVTSAGGYISSDNSTGITTTVTTASLVGKTITIKDGIITGFA